MMTSQQNLQQLSPTQRMFHGRSIFITGASGFIGRVLLEKLLRCYPGIKHVYILMRNKRNKPPQERLHTQLLKVPIFDAIRSQPNGQELLNKIIVIQGDIAEPELGISEPDLQRMLNDESLSIVFHSAATIKFDEPIKVSVRLNLVATRAILNFSRRLPNLISLCHVSTAYANSHLSNGELIEERLYPMSESPEQLMQMSECMSESLMQELKVTLVDKRPNTYTYTKAAAEHLIFKEGADLPIAIVRPSIVVGAWKEPLPGWIDNVNGPTGLILAVGKGLLRTMHTIGGHKADIVPVDIVVNTMIATAFYAAKINNKLESNATSMNQSTLLDSNTAVQHQRRLTNGHANGYGNKQHGQDEIANGESPESPNKRERDSIRQQPPIIHCTSGDLNPVYWKSMEVDMFPIIRRYPSCQVIRYPFGSFKTNYYHDLVTRLFAHYLPALILDLIGRVLGKNTRMLDIYGKLDMATEALRHFRTTNYNFQSKNIRLLSEALEHETDKRELYMDISDLDWRQYWHTYILGARRYVLKENDESLEEARKSLTKAYYIEIALRAFLILVAIALCLPYASRIPPYLSQLWTSPTLSQPL